MQVREQHRRAREKIRSGFSGPRNLATIHISLIHHCKTMEDVHGYRYC